MTKWWGVAKSGGFFYVDRPGGDYVVNTSTEVERNLSFLLEPGETKYVRLSMSPGFFVAHISPKLVEPSVGLSEIAKCKYIGDEVP
jgi:hypothetical protein